jgi:hypothetical protein
MAASHPSDPVLHVEKDDPIGVNNLGKRMITGVFANSTVFSDPTPDQTTFSNENATLGTLIGEATGNHNKVIERDAQCIVVFNLILQLLAFVKPICNHDLTKISLTGFDTNYQPEKLPPPEAPVINRITKGKEAGTYKIYLTRKKNKKLVEKDPKTHMKGVKFYAELSTTPDVANSWNKVCEGVASTKLVFSEVVIGKKNSVRVYGKNAGGKGQPSAPVSFTPDFE